MQQCNHEKRYLSINKQQGCLRGADGSTGLVSSPISQQNGIERFELYEATVKVKRPFRGNPPEPPSRSGSQIQGFSAKSRGRLRFTATNARNLLRSQFGLTFHNYWPVDGRSFKRYLNAFLVNCRRQFPFLQYLWIAEFQSRGAPHGHLFTNLDPTEENRRLLAGIWCRLVDPVDADLFEVHCHQKNFIPWNMGTGSYLCKYLDKTAQKAIPQGFRNFGRWWGNSTGLVSAPSIITPGEICEILPPVDQNTGEVFETSPVSFAMRAVGRYHEHVNRRSWFRKTQSRSVSALTGAPIFRQALGYLCKGRDLENPLVCPF